MALAVNAMMIGVFEVFTKQAGHFFAIHFGHLHIH